MLYHCWAGLQQLRCVRLQGIGVLYLCCLVVHNFLRCQITLVANKQLVDILVCVSVNLIKPLLHIVETFLVCDIVHNLNSSHTLDHAEHCLDGKLPPKGKQQTKLTIIP